MANLFLWTPLQKRSPNFSFLFFVALLASFLVSIFNSSFAADLDFKIIEQNFYSNQFRSVPAEVNKYSNYYILIDEDTGEVLLEKNADAVIAPSSMTKIMTAYVVFDQIEKGNISLTNQCFVSKEAWRGPRLVPGATKMFLKYGDLVTVDELIKGLLIASGNDAAIALAESVAGNLDLFVSLMNFKAAELGLKHSHFMNPHGLSETNHHMSVRDLAILTQRIRKDFPQYMGYFTLPEVDYNNVEQNNHNPLIKQKYRGATGMKTGYTVAGGYGIVGSATRDGRNLIAVINRVQTSSQRARAIKNLLDYGFNRYEKVNIFAKGEVVGNLKVLLSDKKQISLALKEDVVFNIPKNKKIGTIRAFVNYKSPLYAPIRKDDKIAQLIVTVDGYKNFKFDLYAVENAKNTEGYEKLIQMTRYKLSGFVREIF